MFSGNLINWRLSVRRWILVFSINDGIVSRDMSANMK